MNTPAVTIWIETEIMEISEHEKSHFLCNSRENDYAMKCT